MTEISVIIPIYNTKQYLHKCINSVLNQTFRNFELILIDDGSTDGSQSICDKYVKTDDRVEVLHIKNMGPSEARNRGLRKAEGRYITFVDSDDYIEHRHLEVLYHAAQKYHADLVMGCHSVEDEDRKGRLRSRILRNRRQVGFEYQKKDEEGQPISKIEAYKLLLGESMMITSAGGKLYHKRLFETVRYPIGEIYEDMKVIGNIIENSSRIVYTPYAGYHYVQRAGSITHEITSHEHLVLLDNEQELAKLIIQKYPEMKNTMKICHIRNCFYLFNGMVLTLDCNAECRMLRKEILKEWRFLVFGKESALLEKAILVCLLPGTVCYRLVKRLILLCLK